MKEKLKGSRAKRKEKKNGMDTERREKTVVMAGIPRSALKGGEHSAWTELSCAALREALPLICLCALCARRAPSGAVHACVRQHNTWKWIVCAARGCDLGLHLLLSFVRHQTHRFLAAAQTVPLSGSAALVGLAAAVATFIPGVGELHSHSQHGADNRSGEEARRGDFALVGV